MSMNNAKGGARGALNQQSGVARTPKHGIVGGGKKQAWKEKKYRGKVSVLPFVEVAMGMYLTYATCSPSTYRVYFSLPFLILFQVGFLYCGVMSLCRTAARARPKRGPRRRRGVGHAPDFGLRLLTSGS
jgi:hypothetical protein